MGKLIKEFLMKNFDLWAEISYDPEAAASFRWRCEIGDRDNTICICHHRSPIGVVKQAFKQAEDIHDEAED